MFQNKKSEVSMELCPVGAGCEYVYLTVNGKKHEFVISTVFVGGFNALLEGLYYLNPEVDDTLTSDACENSPIFSYDSFMVESPYKVEFEWTDEPGKIAWIITKPKNDRLVFDLDIHIENDDRSGEVKIIDFKIGYKEFCYAVVKAASDAIKRHGLLGYHKAIYYEDMNIRCLLKLKAYVLDCEQEIKVTNYTAQKGDVSSLEAELRLLMRDM